MTIGETVWSSGPWPFRFVPLIGTNQDIVLAALFPDGVVFEQMDPATADIRTLHAEEAAIVVNAVESRQREFAAGRLCARRALARLGSPVAALLVESDRRPRWPYGTVGSISHTEGFCGVAATNLAIVIGIGFDVEPRAALPLDVWPTVLSDAEHESLHAMPDRDRGVYARLAFSAKEAFYKCYRSTGGGWLDFHDIEIRFSAAPGEMTAEVLARKRLWNRAPSVLGAFAISSQFIFTAFTMIER